MPSRFILPAFVTVFCLVSSCDSFAQNSVVNIGAFSSGTLECWKSKDFKGITRYQTIEENKQKFLRAQSRGTASGLYRDVRIDLDQTPILHWSWRIENPLSGLNEQSKTGDDYAARVYVIIRGGIAFWKTRALNYVWSGNPVRGRQWENAFAGKNAIMIAVRSSKDPIAQWIEEKRNVKSDLKKHFGNDIRYIDAVAIMTDTDNSGREATADYGDIYFSAE